jgi:glycosyltransferase involved in cell wall biosynthesis
LNILISSSAAPDRGSGISAYAKDLAESFVRKGHEVRYLAPAPDDHSWLQEHGITLLPVEPQGNQIKQAQELLTYMNAHEFDGAINNDNSLLQSISPAVKCPVVSVCHCNETAIFGVAGHQWNGVDYVVALSPDMQGLLQNAYGIPPARCPVIFGGTVDRGEPVKSEPTVTALRVIVGADYGRCKNTKLLIDSLTAPRADWKDISVNWYGNLPKALAHRLNDTKHVHYHGRVPRGKFLHELRNSDVFLLPSRSEGCPVSLLEAMSFGVVPIVSDGLGAMRWVVQNGLDGYVCRLDNWLDDSSACLEQLKSNPALLADMKDKARAKFLQQYKAEFVADKLLALLRAPTVERPQPTGSLGILAWHRLARPGFFSNKFDRVRYRFGLPRIEGRLNPNEV